MIIDGKISSHDPVGRRFVRINLASQESKFFSTSIMRIVQSSSVRSSGKFVEESAHLQIRQNNGTQASFCTMQNSMLQ